MSLSTVTLTPYSVASSIDQKTIDYYFTLAVGSGNYQLGGIPMSFAGFVAAPGAPIDVRIKSIASPVSGKTYQYSPNGQNQATITNLALTSNVVTITAENLFKAGDQVTLSGLTTSTFLNGQTVTVISTGLSGTQFEFNFTHGNVSSGAETGTASKGSAGQTYGALQVFAGATEQSAGATPASITGDTILCIAKFRRG